MIITVASFKGGVGKSTTAVHLAAFIERKAGTGSTLLVDGDPNRSVTGWAKRGSLPFPVCDERQAAKLARQYDNLVFDTKARPERDDLKELAEGCDLLIIPTTPDALSMDALILTVNALQDIGSDRYRILLTIVPPKPNLDGEGARRTITEAELPIFKGEIPRLVVYQRAALQGCLVRDVKDERAEIAWNAYQAIGKEILNNGTVKLQSDF
jgi:chromosome partitioning protein